MFEGIGNPLFFVGVVEDNVDPRFEGRIKVRAFGFHGLRDEVKTTELPWAICAKGDYDANGPLPPLNSFVYGMFLDGRDAQHPLVLGLIPSQFAEKFDPVGQGWGVIPTKHGKELAKGKPALACRHQYWLLISPTALGWIMRKFSKTAPQQRIWRQPVSKWAKPPCWMGFNYQLVGVLLA